MSGEARTPTLPPWLWIWIAITLYGLPERLRGGFDTAYGIVADQLGPTDISGWLSLPLVLLSAVDVWPLLVLALGVAAVFLPQLQARLIERRFALADQPPRPLPALAEIEGFLRKQAPKLKIRGNPLVPGLQGFVYPTGYLTSAIAIFGGTLRTWRTDRGQGEALLLHEVAHARFGEAMTFRGGAFLQRTLDLWWVFLLLMIILPVVVFAATTAISIHDLRSQAAALDSEAMKAFEGLPAEQLEAMRAMMPKADSVDALAAERLDFFLSQTLPGVGWNAVAALLWIAVWFVPLTAAIWSAELSADRFAMARETVSGSTLRLLERRSPHASPWNWLLRRVSHPPEAMRRWAARHADHAGVLTLLILLFPASYIVRMAALLGHAAIGMMMTGQADRIPGLLPYGARMFAWYQARPLLVISAVVLLAWPLMAWKGAGAGLPGRYAGRWILYPVLGAALLLVAFAIWQAGPPASAG